MKNHDGIRLTMEDGISSIWGKHTEDEETNHAPHGYQCSSMRSRVNTVTTNVNNVRSRQPVPTRTSNSFSPKRPRDHPLKNMVDRGIFDSGCSGHMTDKPNVKGVGYRWMFDIDYLTGSMNYIPVSLENQPNPHAGTSKKTNNAGTSNASEEKDKDVELIVVPSAVPIPEEIVDSRTSSTKSKKEKILTDPQQEEKVSSTNTLEDNPKIQAFRRELEQIALKHLGTIPENNSTSTPSVNTGSESVNTSSFDPNDSLMSELKIFHKSETGIFDEASYDEEELTSTAYQHKLKSVLLLLLGFTIFTRKVKSLEEPKKIFKSLQDDSWVQAMQEELLQFKLQQVWVLVDLPHGMKVIGTKWVYRNKRDEREVVVRNKARLVAQE
ncbi:putative ribonuclease H-like domain-containing protein [Tanacetum coccineum]